MTSYSYERKTSTDTVTAPLNSSLSSSLRSSISSIGEFFFPLKRIDGKRVEEKEKEKEKENKIDETSKAFGLNHPPRHRVVIDSVIFD